MKLVMTLLVRNEADLIEANLDYHLAQGVDFVIVTDHGSDDGTSEILSEYERMGVAKVIRDEREGHRQDERVTRMVEIARLEHKADWVIHNDADEFWWPLVGSLRDVFASIPPRFGQIEVTRRNFRPCPDTGDDERPFYSRLVYRETSSSNLVGRPLEPKVAHRPVEGVAVAPGNHSIAGADLAAVPAKEVLEIFHFPMCSYEQFERKVLQIGHGYEQLEERSGEVGRDQLELLALLREGKLREYYDGLVVDADALEQGVAQGTLVLDRRLDDFIKTVVTGEMGSQRPDTPHARALLARTMSSTNEIQVEFAAVNKALNDISSRLDDTVQELQSANRSLHLLRTSRVLRYTAPARRLYYRASGRA